MTASSVHTTVELWSAGGARARALAIAQLGPMSTLGDMSERHAPERHALLSTSLAGPSSIDRPQEPPTCSHRRTRPLTPLTQLLAHHAVSMAQGSMPMTSSNSALVLLPSSALDAQRGKDSLLNMGAAAPGVGLPRCAPRMDTIKEKVRSAIPTAACPGLGLISCLYRAPYAQSRVCSHSCMADAMSTNRGGDRAARRDAVR